MSNPDILKVKENDDSQMPTCTATNDALPQFPFIFTIVSPAKSGKSTACASILLRYYKNCFDRIYMFSPTASTDKTTRSYLKAFENDDITTELIVFEDHNDLMNADTYIQEIIDDQNKQEQKKRDRVLIFLDDTIGFSFKKLNYLSSRYRHSNIGILICSQAYRRLDPLVRINSTAIIVNEITNLKELEKIEIEILENVPNWRKHYDYATKERYNFLYFNILEQKLYKNFSELLWEK
jgi:ABC-type dipeptide/oligopeptide/nickel transport system ATPase subunit